MAIPTMTEPTRSRFQFSLSTVLALVVLVAAALGFWLQEQRLAKARRIMAAHGLATEWPDLKEGEVRATVTGRVENESFVLLTMLVETRQSGLMLIKANGNVVLTAGLYPLTDEEPCTGEVRVLVDRVRSLDKDGKPIIKRVLSVGPRRASAQIDSIQSAPDDLKLSAFVRVHAEGSDVVEVGKPISLIEIGTEKFELVVECVRRMASNSP